MQEETEYINVYGARVHNLKNIDAEIPRNSLTAVSYTHLLRWAGLVHQCGRILFSVHPQLRVRLQNCRVRIASRYLSLIHI